MNDKEKIDHDNLISIDRHEQDLAFYKNITDKQWEKFLTEYLNRYYSNPQYYHSQATVTGKFYKEINSEMNRERVRFTYAIRFADGTREFHVLMLTKQECRLEFFDASLVANRILNRLWREFLVDEFPDEIKPVMQELQDNQQVMIDEQYDALNKEFDNPV